MNILCCKQKNKYGIRKEQRICVLFAVRCEHVASQQVLPTPIGCLLCSSLTDLQYNRWGALWPANSHSSAAVAFGHLDLTGIISYIYINCEYKAAGKQSFKIRAGISRAQLENSIPGKSSSIIDWQVN